MATRAAGFIVYRRLEGTIQYLLLQELIFSYRYRRHLPFVAGGGHSDSPPLKATKAASSPL